MKIFYISRFAYHWSTEVYVEHALNQCGVQVVRRRYTSTASCKVLSTQIRKSGADIVLFSKVSSPCFTELIQWCRSHNILTVAWLWDLYWGYRPRKPSQFHADMLFTTDGGHTDLWKSVGVTHRTLRQGIHEPEHIIYPQEEGSVKLAFVGSRASYHRRKILTSWLQSTYGNDVAWYNSTRGLDLNKELAKVKIVVGDTYPAPNYWSNRIYEILGRGGFLLHPRTVGLDEEFADGVHYIGYDRNDYGQLAKLIEYYTTHDEERELIRQAGFRKCGEYTYTARVKEMLRQIEEYRAGNKQGRV